jgi:hypothetical protein
MSSIFIYEILLGIFKIFKFFYRKNNIPGEELV